MTGDEVTASQYQTVSELRLNDVVTIISMNDVLNVSSGEHVPPFSDMRFPPEAGEVGVEAQQCIAYSSSGGHRCPLPV